MTQIEFEKHFLATKLTEACDVCDGECKDFDGRRCRHCSGGGVTLTEIGKVFAPLVWSIVLSNEATDDGSVED